MILSWISQQEVKVHQQHLLFHLDVEACQDIVQQVLAFRLYFRGCESEEKSCGKRKFVLSNFSHSSRIEDTKMAMNFYQIMCRSNVYDTSHTEQSVNKCMWNGVLMKTIRYVMHVREQSAHLAGHEEEVNARTRLLTWAHLWYGHNGFVVHLGKTPARRREMSVNREVNAEWNGP